jgi:hypothetical protein
MLDLNPGLLVLPEVGRASTDRFEVDLVSLIVAQRLDGRALFPGAFRRLG